MKMGLPRREASLQSLVEAKCFELGGNTPIRRRVQLECKQAVRVQRTAAELTTLVNSVAAASWWQITA